MTREEAIKKLQKQKAEYLDEWVDFSGVAEAYDMAIKALQFVEHFDLLKEFQSLQEIVRCKDCRYYCSINDDGGLCVLRNQVAVGVYDDNFCNYGKRRELCD